MTDVVHSGYVNSNLNRLSVISVDTTASEAAPPTPTIPRSPSVESTGEVKTHSSFLSFFGRSRTPAHEEEKTRPTISAPILQKDPSSTPTDTGSAFGSVSNITFLVSLHDEEVDLRVCTDMGEPHRPLSLGGDSSKRATSAGGMVVSFA